ncbi:uncharacterized protein METZ01_LOCUS342840, partial [marine metagenome]
RGQTEEPTLVSGNTIKWTVMALSHLSMEEFGQGNFVKGSGLMETNMLLGKHRRKTKRSNACLGAAQLQPHLTTQFR